MEIFPTHPLLAQVLKIIPNKKIALANRNSCLALQPQITNGISYLV